MSFIMVLIVVLAVLGVLARLVLAGGRSRTPARRDDEDVTSTDHVPPAHPAEPLPGSATKRAQDGMP